MAEKITARIEPASAAQAKGAAAPGASVAEPAEGTQAAGAANAAEATAQAAGDVAGDAAASAPGAFARATQWFDQTFPTSKNAVIGGVVGLVVALLLFSIGLFKTLVIAVLVLVGVAAGQYLDGDPKLVKAVQNLMKKR